MVRVLLHRADGHDLARVDDALVRVQALITETGAKSFQPDFHECLARLAAIRGDAQAAERAFKEARRLYTEMGAPLQAERLKAQTAM